MSSHDRDWMVDAICRYSDDPAKYESDNRGQGQSQEARLACYQCPVKVGCATYALKAKRPCNGMVWGGVPVPEMNNTEWYRRAIETLKIVAMGYPEFSDPDWDDPYFDVIELEETLQHDD